ncbi:hypothetical protein [Oryzomonas rubra]|uniref:Integrase n=1 Tax=Oryzomonas rubra TaxID=2509454 RepID=A0A5A9X5T5_9BACT|nr:hypothetical protein [Oryzomonas rubra]KAA0888144.1 hypothetical protein ET418_17260 [Oryzomonas rubra]
MQVEGQRISLPVSVVSGNSGNAKKNNKVVTESFSTEYSGLLPNHVLLELGKLFRNVDGKSTSSINLLINAINLLCKFMVLNNIGTLQELDFGDLSRLRDLIQVETTYRTEWRSVYNSLSVNSHGTALANRIWPKATLGLRKETTTPAHSIYAYDAMGVALRKEIDRIRGKMGCLAEAIITGKLINRVDLELTRKGIIRGTLSPEFHVSKADIIRTITHYLPGWPVVNRIGYTQGKFGVYEEYRGVRLGCFETREEAAKFVEKQGITAHAAKILPIVLSQKSMNPGELLLSRFSKRYRFRAFDEFFCPHFQNFEDLIEPYYPTVYDWQCIYLYWVWLTGWNNETIVSVVASDLKLGIDIGKHNMIEVIAPNHVKLNGKLPTHWKRRELNNNTEPRYKGEIITGHKLRSQPEDTPKAYCYISDKNNPYDLFQVLADFFELTKPLRRFLNPHERECILMGVSISTNNASGQQISILGGTDHCIPDYKTGLNRFFERNPIYDDTLELLNGPFVKIETATDNPAASPERFTRLWETTATMMRTTYEAWLEHKNVPLWMRRSLMGHESENTTITSYGSERVSIGIRHRRLNGLLNEVEQKIFRGQLSSWEDSAGVSQKATSDNVIQIFSHLKSDIFYCEHPTKPTWPGHEEYVNGHCTEFDECLFCEQCTITKDSLPVLIRWLYDIREMPIIVGPAGISDKVYLRKQAIEEVLSLCHNEGQEWREALERAYDIEMDPTFTAPDFMYRQVMPREG